MVIGICDDDIRTCEELRDEIMKYNQRMNIESEICLFQSGKELLETIDKKTETMQIIFLDIEMPGVNGFEVAKRIQEQNPNLLLIFVTSHDEQVFQAFDFHPFHFIRKEHMKVKLPFVLADAYEVVEAKLRSEKNIVIKQETGDITIKLQDIRYMEVQKHTVVVFLQDQRVFNIHKPLYLFLQEVDSTDFVRISSGCCVHIKHIAKITRHHAVLDDGTSLVGSVAKLKEAKIQIAKYWGKQV